MTKFKTLNLFIILHVFIHTTITYAQDLDKINKKDAIKISGGLNYSSIFYDAKGIENRRQPHTWFLNGNITASILDVSLPFVFNYSNNQIAYTQPFNIQSFNPTYKWIKGYAGITAMNFSQYTLAGHVFTGGGVELSPKNLKIASMYGRLKKASEFDLEKNSDIYMSYKRMGMAFSVGYEKNGHAIKAIYFSAKDDVNSLTYIPINPKVTPMENTVVSVLGKTVLFKKIKLDVEYALSGLTRNLTSPVDFGANPKNQLPVLFKPNATSQFFGAFKSSLGYNYKIIGISLNYERIEPEYQTLGTYYFNNDLEKITIAPSLNLLKGKLNLSLNTGLQRNNLDQSKLNTTKRWVGSINIAFNPNNKWSFIGAYSNFNSYTKQIPQTDPFYKNTLDTLNFYELSQNSMLSSSYRFGNTNTKQSITLSLNYQVTGQNNGVAFEPGLFAISSSAHLPTKVVNGNLGHNITLQKTKTTFGISVNANYSKLINIDNLYYGPNINIGQGLFKNAVRISLGSSYNQVIINSVKTSELFNHRLSINYTPKLKNLKMGQFSINSSFVYLQKIKSSIVTGFNEFTGNLGLNYNF